MYVTVSEDQLKSSLIHDYPQHQPRCQATVMVRQLGRRSMPYKGGVLTSASLRSGEKGKDCSRIITMVQGILGAWRGRGDVLREAGVAGCADGNPASYNNL